MVFSTENLNTSAVKIKCQANLIHHIIMSFTPADEIESIELIHTSNYALCWSVWWPVCQNNPVYMVQNQPTPILSLWTSVLMYILRVLSSFLLDDFSKYEFVIMNIFLKCDKYWRSQGKIDFSITGFMTNPHTFYWWLAYSQRLQLLQLELQTTFLWINHLRWIILRVIRCIIV